MKQRNPSHAASPHAMKWGVTLVEMTVVILLILTLLSLGTFSAKKISDWKLGRAASEVLRSVYSAQRLYLSDRPTTLVENITAADLLPYMPEGTTEIPTVESLEGTQLPIIVNTSPPIINGGSGVSYDPSGSTNDSLWDVGE